VLCDTAHATVLIDPLVPPGEKRLLGALDEHVSRRGRQVAVLTTIGFHRRSRDQQSCANSPYVWGECHRRRQWRRFE
jgi:hypothetical protein